MFTWISIAVGTMIMQYHVVGFDTCLMCLFVETDTLKFNRNEEFARTIFEALVSSIAQASEIDVSRHVAP